VRIISGSARGRPIAAPVGSDVRPTTDRVREAVFNTLYSAGAFTDVEEVTAVDLFAGTGALGLEALSRGVGRVIFVERSRSAVAAITENLDAFGFADRATIVNRDVFAWLKTLPGGGPEATSAGRSDLVFCDPPYAFDSWPSLLDLVESRLEPRFLVVESDSAVELGSSWSEFKTARYASTVVQVARPDGASTQRDS